MEYYIGIDLGGTNVKTGIVDRDGNIIVEDSRPTAPPGQPDVVTRDMVGAVVAVINESGLNKDDVLGIGIGCPGTIDPHAGMVVYSNNLDWRDYPLRDIMQDKTWLPVYLGNDANVAALGEVVAGSAKDAQSAVVMTLGTGVGAGVIIEGRIVTGYNSAASEFGHMVIVKDGELCTCGRKGCLESYAAAPGLIRDTKRAMLANPESKMWQVSPDIEKVDGRTSFDAKDMGDAAAVKVVDDYISYLACGIANIINALQPEVISLGGGVANQGENLLVPLREKVYAEVYGGKGEKSTRLEQCTLGYKAGIIGAAMLVATQG